MKRGDVIGTVFFLALFAAVFILSYIIVRPFLTALLAGALLAYIAYPVYRLVLGRIGSKSMSALLVSVLVIFVVNIPSFLVLTHLTHQAQALYLQTKEHLNGPLYGQECPQDNFICGVIAQAELFFTSDFAKDYITDMAQGAVKFLTSKITDLVL